MRLLIIEDDLALVDLLSQSLGAVFKIDIAFDCLRAKRLLSQHSYRLIVLRQSVLENKNLPHFKIKSHPAFLLLISGFACLRQFDWLKPYPCDFLIEPFIVDQLELKIKNLLERQKLKQKNTIQLPTKKKLLLNGQTQIINYQNQSIKLNRKEFVLLKLLMSRQGQALSRELLANLIWEDDLVVFGNSIATNVASLRRKLEVIACPHQIKTLRGVGYFWSLE